MKALLQRVLENAQADKEIKFTHIDDNNHIQTNYQRIVHKAKKIASRIQQVKSITKQDRVLLIYSPGLEFISSLIACFFSNVIPVPAYPPSNNRQLDRLKKIILSCSPKLVLAEERLESSISKLKELCGIDTIITDTNRLNDNVAGQIVEPSCDMIAFLQYTSGSTSDPKGVIIKYKNLNNHLISLNSQWGLSSERPVVNWLPVQHDLGLIGGLLTSLYNGNEYIQLDPATAVRHPYIWLKALSDYKAYFTSGPNFSYQLCVDKIFEEELETLDLSSVGCALAAAETNYYSTMQAFCKKFLPCGFKKSSYCVAYGLAEATLCVSSNPPNTESQHLTISKCQLEKGYIKEPENSEDKLIIMSAGQLQKEHEVVIIGPKTNKLSLKNKIGEICVNSLSVADGYWKNKTASEKVFQTITKDGQQKKYLRTGDLGFIVGDALYMTGREKDLIIIDGRNIYPQDIEYLIERTTKSIKPGSTAAFSVNNGIKEDLVISAEIKAGLEENKYKSLITILKKTVYEYFQVPIKEIVLLNPGASFKTTSGKIQRHLTKTHYLNKNLDLVKIYDVKKTKILKSKTLYQNIKNIFCDVLNVRDISADARFSELGGTSLQANMLYEKLREFFPNNAQISETIAFEYPSLNSLYKHLSKNIKENKNKIKENKNSNKVAIIGLGIRLPGSINDINKLWKFLSHGGDGIRQMPVERWPIDNYDKTLQQRINQVGTINGVGQFDEGFFNISPKEANRMDFQHQLLLELAWSSLEDAGVSLKDINKETLGIYIGISSDDYKLSASNKKEKPIDAYFVLDSSNSVASGRIAYFLGASGPAISIDTACSSSLVALHMAAKSILNGETSIALAGGVNILLYPKNSISLSRANMLSKSNRCNTFSEDADGYVRGEGCMVLTLKLLDDAIKNKDHIYGVIRSSIINQDGKSSALTVPSRNAQKNLLEKSLKEANLKSTDVSYIEAHGSATSLGDLIEFGAISDVYGHDLRNKKLGLGSIKSNIGHLEAAAGLAGVAKIVASFSKESIPKNINCEKINNKIHMQKFPIEVLRENLKWPEERKKIAGVSSFGFSGTNAHIILEGPPLIKTESNNNVTYPNHLLLISAKSEKALSDYVDDYIKYLENAKDPKIEDIAYTLRSGRETFEHKIALLAKDHKELLFKLKNHDYKSSHSNSEKKITCLLFTGQGSQYSTMGFELYKFNNLFRETIDFCCSFYKKEFNYNLKEIWLEGQNATITKTQNAQTLLFIIEYALYKLWQSFGVEPDLVCGHSIGEYAAIVAAGGIALEDALRLVYHRGRLIQSLKQPGTMLVITHYNSDAKSLISQFQEKLDIAAINTPSQIVLSGSIANIKLVKSIMDQKGVNNQLLCVSHAFHSRLMEPVLAEFEKIAEKIKYKKIQVPFISSLTSQLLEGTRVDAKYWVEHIRCTVNFSKTIELLNELGTNIALEIGPDPILVHLSKQALPESAISWIYSMSKSQSNWSTILTGLGQLYMAGFDINWDTYNKYSTAKKISLPTYPFQRNTYPPPHQETSEINHYDTSNKDLEIMKKDIAGNLEIYETHLSIKNRYYLKSHQVFNYLIFPGCAIIDVFIKLLERNKIGTYSLEFVFKFPIILEISKNIKIQITKDKKNLALYKKSKDGTWIEHAKLIVNEAKNSILQTKHDPLPLLNNQNLKSEHKIDITQFYTSMKSLGINYGSHFQVIKNAYYISGFIIAEIHCNDVSSHYISHPPVIDGCFQAVGLALLIQSELTVTLVPSSIQSMLLKSPIPSHCWVVVNKNEIIIKDEEITASFYIADINKNIIGNVKNLRLSKTNKAQLEALSDEKSNIENLFYQWKWQPYEGNYIFNNHTNLYDLNSKKLKPLPIFNHKVENSLYLLEKLGLFYVHEWFEALNTTQQLETSFSTSDIMHYKKIKPGYDKLVNYFLHLLAEHGFLKKLSQDRWMKSSSPNSLDASLLKDDNQAIKIEKALLIKCGSQLTQILKGELDPLELLFDDKNKTSAITLYQDSIIYSQVNLRLAKLFETIINNIASDITLRILEIGAGSGGTTQHIIPKCLKHKFTYTYTDISSSFFYQAKKMFSESENIIYRVLDIEKPPNTQGFIDNQYDIVICANILHATKDISHAIENIKKLLTPGGVLFLLESTKPAIFTTLTFGLLDGWWHFNDKIRKKYPLLNKNQWCQLLKNSGYKNVKTIDTIFETTLSQSIIVSQTETIKQESLFLGPDQEALIISPRHVTTNELANALPFTNKSVVYYDPSIPNNNASISDQGDYYSRFESNLETNISNKTSNIFFFSSFYNDQELNSPNYIETYYLHLLSTIKAINKKFSLSAKESDANLIVITNQVFSDNPSLQNLSQSPLWGLVRSAQNELFHLKIKIIDIKNQINLPETIHQIIFILIDKNERKQYVIDENKILIGKLLPEKYNNTLPSNVNKFSTGACVITGGLSGLGYQTCLYLISQGAKSVALLSRSNPNEKQRKFLSKLNEKNTQVVHLNVDVGNLNQLDVTLKKVRKDFGPIAYIFHCAGCLDDATINNQDVKKMRTVFSPKAYGAWNLHRLTIKDNIKTFVLFSSVSSFLGPVGQSNHSAANMFLNQLSEFRQKNNLSCISINWGAWSETGSATKIFENNSSEHLYFKPITNRIGISALNTLLFQDKDPTNPIVFPLNKDINPNNETPTILRDLFNKKKKNKFALKYIPSLNHLNESIDTTKENLYRQLSMELSEILELKSEHTIDQNLSFQAMGLDSLMVIEFQKRLQALFSNKIKILPQLLFEHSTLKQLVDYFHQVIQDNKQLKNIDKIDSFKDSKNNLSSSKNLFIDSNADIAIISMSFKLPGNISTEEELIDLLINRKCTVTEIPLSRFRISQDKNLNNHSCNIYTKFGSFIHSPELFDADFFNIPPREAILLDPQIRLLLEKSIEAFEKANICLPNDFKTGIFIGAMNQDYKEILNRSLTDSQIAMAIGYSALSGRLAYALGTHGPSMTVDTACSSSLVSIHLATQSLRSKECDIALAGGVNLILTPTMYQIECNAKMLSVDGHCKTFDESADGFVRGEGLGLVILKRLNDAIDNNDHILAVIKGSAVNSDGRTTSYSVPNVKAQKNVIQEALDNAQLNPSQIDAVEAHGTGTKLGDPIELTAINQVYGKNRSESIYVSSAKTNFGHLEGAAGVLGLLKAILQIKQKNIYPHINFNRPTNNFDWSDSNIKVPISTIKWSKSQKHMCVALSSFGFSGTNAHMIIEEYKQPFQPPMIKDNLLSRKGEKYLFPISAKNKFALEDYINKYITFLTHSPKVEIENLAYTMSTCRTHYKYRICIVAEDKGELLTQLKQHHSKINNSHPLINLKLAMLFTGQARQYPKMGLELYMNNSIFRNVADSCFNYYQFTFSYDLKSIWINGDTDNLSRAEVIQPLLFIIQYALYAVWRNLGITPRYVCGHGVGEYAAATAAEVFTPEEALTLLYHRAKLMDLTLDEFKTIASKIKYNEPKLEMITSLVNSSYKKCVVDEKYWVDNLRKTVNFSAAINYLTQSEVNTFIEIGPGDVLTALVNQTSSLEELIAVSSMKKNYDSYKHFLTSLSVIYVTGYPVNWNNFYKDKSLAKISLPTYPFHRKYFWLDKDESTNDNNVIQSNSYYQLRWVPRAASTIKDYFENSTCWIFSESTNVMEKNLFNPKSHLNFKYIILKKDNEEFTNFDTTNHNFIDPLSIEDFKKLFKQPENLPDCIIYHEFNPDISSNEEVSIEPSKNINIFGLLNLIQVLKIKKYNPRLILITTSAQEVFPNEKIKNLTGSMLLGLGKTVYLEFPELNCLMIDFDFNISLPEKIKLINVELNQPIVDNQVAYREGRRYLPQLKSINLNASQNLSINQDGLYLITGGIGGLGFVAAQALLENGAKSIMLCARHLPSKEINDTIHQLNEKYQAKISFFQCDVTQKNSVMNMFKTIKSIKLPLLGIIHAAGIIQIGPLSEITTKDITKILKPKVDGAWNIHYFSRKEPLDFFLLFSSFSSVLSSNHQGIYAAANGFLDNLALFRRAKGLPAHSISWAPWADIGFAKNYISKKQLKSLSLDHALISIEEGKSALIKIITSDAYHVSFISNQYLKFMIDFYPKPLPSSVSTFLFNSNENGHLNINTESDSPTLPVQLNDEDIKNLLGEEIKKILKLDFKKTISLNEKFSTTGFDSLTAVELIKNLSKKMHLDLEPTLTIQHDNINSFYKVIVSKYHAHNHSLHAPLVAKSESKSLAKEKKFSKLTKIATSNLIEYLLKKYNTKVGNIILHGESNIPAKGPCIIAINHAFWWDRFRALPFLSKILGHLDSKPYVFSTRKLKIFGPLIKAFYEPIYLTQSYNAKDIHAINQAIHVLKNNRSLIIFPEGKQNRGKLRIAKHGVGYIAIQANLDILPITLYKTKGKIAINIPPVVSVKNYKNSNDKAQEITHEVMLKIATALPKNKRGHYE